MNTKKPTTNHLIYFSRKNAKHPLVSASLLRAVGAFPRSKLNIVEWRFILNLYRKPSSDEEEEAFNGAESSPNSREVDLVFGILKLKCVCSELSVRQNKIFEDFALGSGKK